VRGINLAELGIFGITWKNELRGATGNGNLTVFQDKQFLGGGDNYPIELEE
jgi:hypothetical protein